MINIRKLDSGITVVMDKIEYVQSAAIGMFVRAGAIDENQKYAGISHFVEHMTFKGTEKRNAKQIVDEIDILGSQINAFTSKEMTCYYVKALSANLYKSTEVLLDMLTNSVYDEKEMNRERKVIGEEIKMTEDTPDDAAHELISKVVNKGTLLENSIAGTYETISNINPEVMKEYVKKQYAREDIVISVAGNFDEEKLLAFLEGKFDKLSRKKDVKKIDLVEYNPGFETKIKNIEQTHIFLGVPSIKLTDDRYYSMTLLSNMFGGSMSSRLFQNVREEKGLAYAVYSVNAAAMTGGNFLIYAGVGHENIAPAISAIKEELLAIKNDGFTKEEIFKSKEQLKASYIFGLENVASRMFSIGKSLALKDEILTDDEVLAKIDALDMDNINESIKVVSDIDSYSAATLTNKEINLEDIVKNA